MARDRGLSVHAPRARPRDRRARAVRRRRGQRRALASSSTRRARRGSRGRSRKVIFWAPDGTEVRVAEGDVGYVLDRTRFEPALAARGGRAGAEILIGTEATGLTRDGDGWLVAVRGAGARVRDCARALVIAADGVEGWSARWAGLDTRVPSRDMESCAQYLMTNVNVDPGRDLSALWRQCRARRLCVGVPQGRRQREHWPRRGRAARGRAQCARSGSTTTRRATSPRAFA